MQDITARHFLELSFTWPQVYFFSRVLNRVIIDASCHGCHIALLLLRFNSVIQLPYDGNRVTGGHHGPPIATTVGILILLFSFSASRGGLLTIYSRKWFTQTFVNNMYETNGNYCKPQPISQSEQP